VIENASPLELIDARLALEPHICRLAVLNATQNDFRKADQLLSEMDASVSDPNTFSEADNAFHTLLVKTTGNRLLIWIMSQINTVRNQEQWSRMRHLTLNETSIAKYNQQHREILNKLRTREPDRAGELMKKHLETARLSLNRVAST
jgi:GntR family uxuAB operon transcriptional repressor